MEEKATQKQGHGQGQELLLSQMANPSQVSESSNNTSKTTQGEGHSKKKTTRGDKTSTVATTIATAAAAGSRNTTATTIEDEAHLRQMFSMFQAAFPQGNEELRRQLFPRGLRSLITVPTTTKDFAPTFPSGKPHCTRECWQINKKLLRKTSRSFTPSTRERTLGFRNGLKARYIHRASTYNDDYV